MPRSSSPLIRIASPSSSSMPNRPAPVVFGFGEGWNEHEYDPSTGELWRWTSDRSAIRVRAAGRPLAIRIRGVSEAGRDVGLTVRAGDTVVASETCRRGVCGQHDDPGRGRRQRGEPDHDRDRRELRAGRDPMADAGSAPARPENPRVPHHAGFLARHRSELPNGQSNDRSHQLSTRRTAVSSALTGAGGTVMSFCA